VGNPYKRKCPHLAAGECGRFDSSRCHHCRMWDSGHRAGLEAAAGRCEQEHDALEETARGRSGWFRAITEERAIACARLADEIRAMKGDE
jgi:hypothetical protein